jgi:hypothetical protein
MKKTYIVVVYFLDGIKTNDKIGYFWVQDYFFLGSRFVEQLYYKIALSLKRPIVQLHYVKFYHWAKKVSHVRLHSVL